MSSPASGYLVEVGSFNPILTEHADKFPSSQHRHAGPQRRDAITKPFGYKARRGHGSLQALGTKMRLPAFSQRDYIRIKRTEFGSQLKSKRPMAGDQNPASGSNAITANECLCGADRHYAGQGPARHHGWTLVCPGCDDHSAGMQMQTSGRAETT